MTEKEMVEAAARAVPVGAVSQRGVYYWEGNEWWTVPGATEHSKGETLHGAYRAARRAKEMSQ